MKEQGSDGKILLVMAEDGADWRINQILVTLQQKDSVDFIDFIRRVIDTLRIAYESLQRCDRRWKSNLNDIDVLVNPGGLLVHAGSDGDNGQTGRKLVMDFYGPKIAIGGGALYGKHIHHIDRLGATMGRKFAVNEVKNGAKEVIVRVCYAPAKDASLSPDIQSDRRPTTDPMSFFRFSAMREQSRISDLYYDDVRLGAFYNDRLSFNGMAHLGYANIE